LSPANLPASHVLYHCTARDAALSILRSGTFQPPRGGFGSLNLHSNRDAAAEQARHGSEACITFAWSEDRVIADSESPWIEWVRPNLLIDHYSTVCVDHRWRAALHVGSTIMATSLDIEGENATSWLERVLGSAPTRRYGFDFPRKVKVVSGG
jgi:hypothetical protein